MKKLLILFLCISLSTLLHAKNPTNHEIGIQTSDFSDFGLMYKWGDSQSMWRMSIVSLTGSNSHLVIDVVNDYPSADTKLNTFGLAIGGGKEFYIHLSERLYLSYGGEFRLGYSSTNNSTLTLTSASVYGINESTTNQVLPSVNGILGLSYRIHKKLVIGTELRPYVSFNHSVTHAKLSTYNLWGLQTEIKGRNISNIINYGISSNNLTFFASYRF